MACSARGSCVARVRRPVSGKRATQSASNWRCASGMAGLLGADSNAATTAWRRCCCGRRSLALRQCKAVVSAWGPWVRNSQALRRSDSIGASDGVD